VSALLATISIALVVDAVMARVTMPVPRRPGAVTATRPGRQAHWRAPARRFPCRPRPPGPGEVAMWCDAVARRVRSGDALSTAVAAAPGPGRMAPVAAALRQRVERGTPVAAAVAAVTDVADRADRADAGPSAGLALEVVGVVASVGGPVAEPLERVAATLRQRVADLHERQAQTAQARLSAAVMSVLPVAALGAAVSVSAPVRSAVTTPIGLASIALGAALNVGGWCWMRRIVGPTR
jgi:tight adherence protein B